MAVENGEWIMYGLDWDNPYRIRSYQELINWINEVGFLPLFRNEIEGFSAEEHTSPRFWWTGDREQDSSLFIFLKTVKKFLYPISFYKQCKTIWLDFIQ